MEILIGIILIAAIIYLLSKVSGDKKAESYADMNKQIDESMQKSEEESLKEYKQTIRSRMERRKLVMDVLYEIGCIPEIDDEDYICFKYQGAEYSIDADNNYAMITIWCFGVYITEIEELSIVQEAINETNLNSFAKYIYAVNESHVRVHTKSQISFIAQIPELEKYLRIILEEVFASYKEVFQKEIEHLKMKRIGLN